MREAQILRRRGGIEIILQRLRAIFDALGIGVRARGRGAKLMIDNEHRPVASGRSPIQCVALQWKCNCRAVLVHSRRAHRAGRELAMHNRASGNRNLLRDFKRLHAQLRLLRCKLAARKAARIAGIIDDPHAHIPLLCFLDQFVEECQVLRREIRKRHIVASLHGDRLEAESMQRVQIALDLRNAYRAVQSVVRLWPVLRRGEFHCAATLAAFRFCNCCQDCCE